MSLTPYEEKFPLTPCQKWLREWAFAGAAEEEAKQSEEAPQHYCMECGYPSPSGFWCSDSCRESWTGYETPVELDTAG